VQLQTGHSETSAIFVEASENDHKSIERKSKDYSLTEVGYSVLLKAVQRLDFYTFENLKAYLPHLKSVHELLTSPDYLGTVKVEITGSPAQIANLKPEEKLYAALKVLEHVARIIASDRVEYKGTREFKPYMIKDIIKDKTLAFSIDEGDDKEFGKSMKDVGETKIHLDLDKREWFAFDDCFGTSEEKYLVKFVDKRYDDLKKKYSDVYLIRNDRTFKLYKFDDGTAVEPDFVLYLIGKKKNWTMYYQVFIEPKGGHLLKQDEWKEKFLMQLRNEAALEQLWDDRRYAVWGLPFFNEHDRMPEFEEAFKELPIMGDE